MKSNLAEQEYGYTDNERQIAEGFVAEAYDSLLVLARSYRRRSKSHPTMMTEDILHESYLKLSGKTVWQSYEQYVRTASLAIRQVIVDHARKKCSVKHGGEASYAYSNGEPVFPEFTETPEQILIVNDLLNQLEEKQPRLSVIVGARYFAALTESETATALGLSERTVRRDWQAARSWLASKMAL